MIKSQVCLQRSTFALLKNFLKMSSGAVALAFVIAFSITVTPDTAVAATEQVVIQSSVHRNVVLQGHLHRPSAKGRAPAVVLMHGCGGWQPAVLKGLQDYAKFLTASGFVVLNLDSFGVRRKTGGVVCQSFESLADARRYRTNDAFDGLRFLRAQTFVDPDNIFLIGQSNGGSVAMISATVEARGRHMKTSPGFKGIVALYPWCGATGSRRPNLDTPLLILGGAKDDWVPPRDCQRMTSRGAALSVKVYQNAAHSFDVPVPVHRYLGNLVGYSPNAASDAKSEILAFFKSNIQRQTAIISTRN